MVKGDNKTNCTIILESFVVIWLKVSGYILSKVSLLVLIVIIYLQLRYLLSYSV